MGCLLKTGGVRYAYVGIKTEDLTPAVAKKFGYAATRGALVDLVKNGAEAYPATTPRNPVRLTARRRGRTVEILVKDEG